MENKVKLILALGILSGRIRECDMRVSDWETLGYDASQFAYYGRPLPVNVKGKAEEIIEGCFIELSDRLYRLEDALEGQSLT